MINKFPDAVFMPYEIDGFFDMAKITALRGDHSSGMWGIFKKNPTRLPAVYKTVGDPYHLIHRKEYVEKIVDGMQHDFCAMFGHGRKATSGKITQANAHPFVHKNIILAHNGTLQGVTLKDEVEVDSHALTIDVQKKGVMEALQEVNGAWAIIAYDMNAARILVARNSARPLHYAEANDMIWIMSEREALEFHLKRINRSSTVVKEFTPNHLYEIDPKNAAIDTPRIITPKVNNHYYRHGYESEEDLVDVRALPAPAEKLTLFRVNDTSWALKKGQLVEFLVERIVRNDNNGLNFRYVCTDEQNNIVIFMSHAYDTNLVGKIGFGRVTHAVRPKGWRHGDGGTPIAYFVKKREITWNKITETTAANDDVPEITSKNNVTLDADAWEMHIKGSKCKTCGIDMQIIDIPDTVVLYTALGALEFLCDACVKFWTEKEKEAVGGNISV